MDEEITPRELLDGTWVSCWEALAIAEDRLRDNAVRTHLPAGQILAQMASSGYLPTISNDVTHTQRVPEGHKTVLEMSDEERHNLYEKGQQEEEEKAAGKGKWRLVSPALWAAVYDHSAFEGLHLHHCGVGFKHSSIIAVYTGAKLDPKAPLWEIMNDPDYYMMMARNILVYFDGLYSVDRYARGLQDDDDLYQYKNLDLSHLTLPNETPLAALHKERESWKNGGEEPKKKSVSRGRPGGKNGEPIALLTIKLMQCDEDTLASYTADAAGAELRDLYAVCRSPARSHENCRKDAAGVLRQVRAAREQK